MPVSISRFLYILALTTAPKTYPGVWPMVKCVSPMDDSEDPVRNKDDGMMGLTSKPKTGELSCWANKLVAEMTGITTTSNQYVILVCSTKAL